MDAVLIPRATEPKQSFAPNKQMRMKTLKKNGRGNFVSNIPSQKFDTCAGGLLNPPSRAMSFSYAHSLSASSSLLNNHHSYVQQQQQPALLPLPDVSMRSIRSRDDMPLTVKKSKGTKREEAKKRSGTTQSILIVGSSDTRWGPDPKDLPVNDDVVSGFIFNLAPPPSSLPLPKFSLRSKLICNAEAGGGGVGVDDGATNNLRRLLRLR